MTLVHKHMTKLDAERNKDFVFNFLLQFIMFKPGFLMEYDNFFT